MVHGGWLTGSCYETTADGRPGWAQYFASVGFHVYVFDQPARGRSPYDESVHGPRVPPPPPEVISRFFTATGKSIFAAGAHSQWPGSGESGDALFDRFYSSLVPELAERGVMEQLMREAGASLLDHIGPAYVITHSQSGPHGWHLIDARPHLVRALVAIEPHGPPFYEMPLASLDGPLMYGDFTRPFGLTTTALHFEGEDLFEPDTPLTVVSSNNHDNEGRSGFLQGTPVRALSNFRESPILVVTGEASYHTVYDKWTVDFLKQAGATVTHLELATRGIRGNGHLMMLELSSNDIAAEIYGWFREFN
jgi:pimeloyl-ACP methyl ester carboxylesterase